MKIKEIKIENFRGIKSSLSLNFIKGKKYTSVIIYGKNGSGKSSIVDAWEWFYQNKIEYLAREGAGEKEYPHRLSESEDCYLKVEFDNPQVISIKIEYNKKKVTQPIITGDYESFKEIVAHPCHIRYRDLQNFIYKTKKEKYEYLAKYLGFELALNIQNDLNTFIRKLESEEKELENKFHSSKNKFKKFFIDNEINQEKLFEYINQVISQYCTGPNLSSNF